MDFMTFEYLFLESFELKKWWIVTNGKQIKRAKMASFESLKDIKESAVTLRCKWIGR